MRPSKSTRPLPGRLWGRLCATSSGSTPARGRGGLLSSQRMRCLAAQMFGTYSTNRITLIGGSNRRVLHLLGLRFPASDAAEFFPYNFARCSWGTCRTGSSRALCPILVELRVGGEYVYLARTAPVDERVVGEVLRSVCKTPCRTPVPYVLTTSGRGSVKRSNRCTRAQVGSPSSPPTPF